jgi:hypothetical protein
MKLLIYLYLSFVTINFSYSQSEKGKYIKDTYYEGVILNGDKMLTSKEKKKRKTFTPSIEEIKRLESQFDYKLRILEDSKHNKVFKDSDFILENLSKYKRQYFGLINKKGEKIILVNLFYNKNVFPDWLEKEVFVFDGGHYFWNIQYNLSTKKLFNIMINGWA